MDQEVIKENIYQRRNPNSNKGGSSSEWEIYLENKIGKEVQFEKEMRIEDKSYIISGNFQNTRLNFSGLSKTAHNELEDV